MWQNWGGKGKVVGKIGGRLEGVKVKVKVGRCRCGERWQWKQHFFFFL